MSDLANGATTGPAGEAIPARTGLRERLRDDPLRLTLVAIGAITVVTGGTQIVAPGFVLGLLSAETTEATRHLFATVGMFMVLFGGLLIQALLDRGEHPMVVLWASLQKLGASAAVLIGVVGGVFAAVALAVAGFDLLSGLLGLALWNRIRRAEFGP
jgi:hypothetical protein